MSEYKVGGANKFTDNQGVAQTNASNVHINGEAIQIADTIAPSTQGMNVGAVAGADGVSPGQWELADNSSDNQMSNVSGYGSITLLNPNTLNVGEAIRFPNVPTIYTSVYRVLKQTSATTYITNAEYLGPSAIDEVHRAVGSIGRQDANNYQINGLPQDVHGVALSDRITRTSSQPLAGYRVTGKPTHSRAIMYRTAYVSGLMDSFTNPTYSGLPTTDDYPTYRADRTLQNDGGRGLRGSYAMQYGGRSGISGNLPAKL